MSGLLDPVRRARGRAWEPTYVTKVNFMPPSLPMNAPSEGMSLHLWGDMVVSSLSMNVPSEGMSLQLWGATVGGVSRIVGVYSPASPLALTVAGEGGVSSNTRLNSPPMADILSRFG